MSTYIEIKISQGELEQIFEEIEKSKRDYL